MRFSTKFAVPVLLGTTLVSYLAAPRWVFFKLLVQEKIAVTLFVGSVAAVYVTAAAIFISMLIARLKGKRIQHTRGELWFQRIVLGLAALGAGCIAYGTFVEPYWPEVTRVRIETRKFPPGARPVRIVHISDMHSDPKPRLEERLPQLIAAQKPDLIVFTGDAANSLQGLRVFRKCLSELARLAPTFAVKGNWDIQSFSSIEMFGGTGVRELQGEAVRVEIGTTELWVAGNALWDPARILEAVAQIPDGAFALFLHHIPDLIETAARERVDLYCAGHTHGGQVALPFYGALITLSKYGKRFESGLYRVDETWLYVNRGIGMEGRHAPRVRFCARPEITVIEIVPAG